MMNWNCTQKPNFCSVPDDQKSLWTRCSLFHHRGQLDSANPAKEAASYYFIERKLAFWSLFVCSFCLECKKSMYIPNHPPNCPNCITSSSSSQKTLVWPKTKKKRGKNSQYWLINIIAEVKIECSSIIYLSSNLIKQSRTWNTQSPWYICNSCAYKILLTPKALGIKFLVKYFWDEHIHHLLQVKFECTCILYFSNLLHPEGKANNLSNHWQERENTLCGVPIEGCAFQSSFLFVQWGVTLIRPHQRKFWKLWHFPQNINYTAIFI